MDKPKKNIAVLMAESDEDFEIHFIKGIYDCASANNANICVFKSYNSYSRESRHNMGEYNIFNLPVLSRYDGIILIPNMITPSSVRNDILTRVRESGVPYITIDYYTSDRYEDEHAIMTNNSKPVRQLVEHLIQVHGLKRINFVTGPSDNTESNERFQGYCEALNANGIPLDLNRVYSGAFTGMSGIEAVRYFIKNAAENKSAFPEAIVFANDQSALQGATELIKSGYRIPEDVVVTGYDDTNRAKDFAPRLTTVARPTETIAFHACERILRMIDHEPLEPVEQYSAYPVFRESCGCQSHIEETYDEFRYRMFELYLSVSDSSSEIPDMTRDLYDCQYFDEYYQKLFNYASRLSCDGFYLCVDPDFENALAIDGALHSRGYSDSVTVPVAIKQHERILYPDFQTSDSFPELFDASEQPGLYFFLPLHYQELCFGYFVIKNSLVPFTNSFFNSWTMAVSNSLENLRKQTLLKSMVADLDSKYIRDSLTGLYNRFGFTRYAREALERSNLEKYPLAIIFMDLDSLKYINDHYGHDEGDFVLTQFSQSLNQIFTSGEVICRFGGDEFVVLSENASEEHITKQLVDLDTLLEKLCNDCHLPYMICTSAGFFIRHPDSKFTIEDCVIRADKKMYNHKRKKKDHSE